MCDLYLWYILSYCDVHLSCVLIITPVHTTHCHELKQSQYFRGREWETPNLRRGRAGSPSPRASKSGGSKPRRRQLRRFAVFDYMIRGFLVAWICVLIHGFQKLDRLLKSMNQWKIYRIQPWIVNCNIAKSESGSLSSDLRLTEDVCHQKYGHQKEASQRGLKYY